MYRVIADGGFATRVVPHLTAIASLAVAFEASSAPAVVEWKAHLLTVHAVDSPRQDVLREVAGLTRTPIVGIENVSGPFSIELDKVPLGSALRALAGGHGDAITEMLPMRKGVPTHYELQFAGPGVTAPPNGPAAAPGASFPAPPVPPSMTGGASFPAPSLPQPEPSPSSPDAHRSMGVVP